MSITTLVRVLSAPIPKSFDNLVANKKTPG